MKILFFLLLSSICRIVAFFLRITYSYKTHEFLVFFIISRIRSYWLHPIFANCHNSVNFGKIGRIHGSKCISIAEKSFFGDFCYLTAWPEFVNEKPSLVIGENCSFGAFNHITCANKIVIGNNLLTGKWVTISDNNHGDTLESTLLTPPINRPVVSKGPVIIEDNVWIGDKATILAGVHIGNGAIIAANTVVTKDIPAYSVAVGNPARIIK